jgi:AraC-like DNA-binding protein
MNSRLDSIADSEWEGLTIAARYAPESMAAYCSVSLRQLERFFKNHFGETPECWMLKLRCRHAPRLIRQGYATGAVAHELNFTSTSHFCRAFKKLQGRTPQAFAPLRRPEVAKSQQCRLKSIV